MYDLSWQNSWVYWQKYEANISEVKKVWAQTHRLRGSNICLIPVIEQGVNYNTIRQVMELYHWQHCKEQERRGSSDSKQTPKGWEELCNWQRKFQRYVHGLWRSVWTQVWSHTHSCLSLSRLMHGKDKTLHCGQSLPQGQSHKTFWSHMKCACYVLTAKEKNLFLQTGVTICSDMDSAFDSTPLHEL